MILQHPTLLDGMALIPMIRTIQALVPPRQVTPHLVQLFKIQLILNLIYDLVHWLFERHIHLSHLYFRFLYS